MLREAGAASVAARVDPAVIAAAMPAVRAEVARMQAAGAPVIV